MFLLHLLRLLLMALLHLLLPLFVHALLLFFLRCLLFLSGGLLLLFRHGLRLFCLSGLLLRIFRVLLLLFLLELLPVLSLPAIKLLLVLLESSVLFRVPGTRRAHSRIGWQFLRMNRASGEPGRLLRAIRAVTPALLGVHNAGFGKITGARSRCDRGLSVVRRSA